MIELSDDDLLAELEVSLEQQATGRSAREERIIAGFEDIQRFVEAHGRLPRHGQGLDIFERLYAVRLERLRTLADAREALKGLDVNGLLDGGSELAPAESEILDDDALMGELGEGAASPDDDIQVRKNVSSGSERRAAEEVANRSMCAEFERFRPLFEQAESDLKAGVRETRLFGKDASVEPGDFFVLGGQFVYVAELGKPMKTANGKPDARLRVIYSNGTESNLLLRSLQRALYKDEAGRRLRDPSPGPLFGETWEEDEIESGTIYVLRSLSEHEYVAKHRELIHKIGVTGGRIEARIAQAAHDATYLLANVEIVASYKLARVNRTKLEKLFHRIFGPAQLNLTIHDRFGHPVQPQEWFFVPLQVIDEAVKRIMDGSITEFVYDPASARLVET